MSSLIKNVLVFGASDTTCAPILAALRRRRKFKLAIAMRPGSSVSAIDPSVAVHIVDYHSPISLDAAFKGQDAIVSGLTIFAVPIQQAIIDAAIRAGVKRLIPSDYGINTTHPSAGTAIPTTTMKRDTIAYLRQRQGLGASRLSWTAICVESYPDWAMRTGYFGGDSTPLAAQLLGDETSHPEATNLARIGETVAKCLEKPVETSNRYVYIHSVHVTQAKVSKAIDTASTHTWRKERQRLDGSGDQGMRTGSTTEMNRGAAIGTTAVRMGSRAKSKFSAFRVKAAKWEKKLGLEDDSDEEALGELLGAMVG